MPLSPGEDGSVSVTEYVFVKVNSAPVLSVFTSSVPSPRSVTVTLKVFAVSLSLSTPGTLPDSVIV